MKLTNTWVGYLVRTYEQIEASVRAQMAAKLPEITDRSRNNPFIKMLGVWYSILELISYYTDNGAREAHLSTCRYFKSAVFHAERDAYRVKGAGAATTPYTFTVSAPLGAPLTIPGGFEVRNGAGVRFFTTGDITIGIGDTEGAVDIVQAVTVTGEVIGQTDGTPKQSVTVEPASGQVVDGSVGITINAVTWEPVDSFIFSGPADKHFVAGQNRDGVMSVTFGDDVNGAIPPSVFNIVAGYQYTDGVSGNLVTEDSINTLVTPIVVPGGLTLTGNNADAPNGGYEKEGIEDIRRAVPLFKRTRERAVTRQDYADLASLVVGVAKAGVVYECGKFITIYIAPTGGGLPSGAFITDVEDYVDDRKMTTTNVTIKGAGVVKLELEADVFLADGYVRADVDTALRAALLDFLSVANQDIFGKAEEGDIYQILETASGVRYSRLKKMRIIPYARPLDATTAVLAWSAEITAASAATTRWTVVFTDADSYQLLKDGTMVGAFDCGAEVTQPEVVFTITGAYTAGDAYEFYTYAEFGTVQLVEPSYLETQTGLITLNLIGGI